MFYMRQKMKYVLVKLIFIMLLTTHALHLQGSEKIITSKLTDLLNYQINSAQLISSGLPISSEDS